MRCDRINDGKQQNAGGACLSINGKYSVSVKNNYQSFSLLFFSRKNLQWYSNERNKKKLTLLFLSTHNRTILLHYVYGRRIKKKKFVCKYFFFFVF